MKREVMLHKKRRGASYEKGLVNKKLHITGVW